MLTDSQVKKQLFWTNGCFRATLIEYYANDLGKNQKKYNLYNLKLFILENLNKPIDTPEINQLYLSKVLQLDSKRLNIILRATQTGQCRRHQETIDAITTELFERAVSETREIHESKI